VDRLAKFFCKNVRLAFLRCFSNTLRSSYHYLNFAFISSVFSSSDWY
jgi:hypothetical protein